MDILRFIFFNISSISIYVLATLFSITSSQIPEDLVPLKEYDTQDTFNYTVFRGAESTVENDNDTSLNQLHDFQGMVRIGNLYYIYGRENIFVVGLQGEDATAINISLKQTVEWKSNDADVALCLRKGQTREKCKSFIKLFQEDAKRKNKEKQIIVCSTNAFSPACRIYQILTSGNLKLTNEKLSENLLCPHNPEINVANLLANGNLYTATVIGFGGQDSLLLRSYRSSTQVNLRTPRGDRATLNDPSFIRFVDPGGQKIFIFFKETAVEDQQPYKIYSRVGQACKNDQGGTNFLRNQFSSFFKARLNCSLPGQPNFYFDEISDVTDFVTLNSLNKSDEKMVFAIMNTPRNSIPASAICAYTLKNIESALTGSFMEKHSSIRSSKSYWEEKDNYPKPHLARCDRPTKLSHSQLNFIRKHPLMHDSVQSWSEGVKSNPLFIKTNSRNFLTSLAVDIVSGNSLNYTVIFAGNEEGKLFKILLLNSTKTILLEERMVYNEEKCPGKKSLRKIVLDKSSGSVLVAFQNCVVRTPLCPLLESTCARECVQSRDPYCGWNGTNCVTVDRGYKNNSIRTSKNLLQDVLDGNVDALPNCELTETDGAAGKNESGTFELTEFQLSDNHSTTSTATTIAVPGLIQPRNEETDESHLYVIAGIVCLVFGFVFGLLVCVFQRKWQLKKEKENLQSESEYDKSSSERRDSYNNRSSTIGSHYVKRNSNPRVSLIVEPKRKRTITETSYKSEEGLLFCPGDTNLAQENTPENNFLHPARAIQMTSTSSGEPDKIRKRSLKPSVNSDKVRNEDVSDSSERHPSPLSDIQYEDPFSDDAETIRHRSMETGHAPEIYPASVPLSAVRMRAPPSRSMSFQGGYPLPLNRAYSIGNNGSHTLGHAQAPSKPPDRKFSLQLQNGLPNPNYLQHLVSNGPQKTYSWINQSHGEPPVAYDKSNEPVKINTEFTHSLDRRRRRPNGQINLSESYSERSHPMAMYKQNAYPARKRIASESEKVGRAPTMSRAPRHQAITEEEEMALAHHKRRNLSAKFLRNHLKLEIPKNNHLLAHNQMGQSPPIQEYPNVAMQKSEFSKRLLNHSTPVTPIRDFNGAEQESPRRFSSQQRSFEMSGDPLVTDTTPFFPHSSSPRSDCQPPSLTNRDKMRQFSGSLQQPLPSPKRISASVALASLDAGTQRIRHHSGGMPMRIPHSPIDGPQNYIGPNPVQQITTDGTSLIFT